MQLERRACKILRIVKAVEKPQKMQLCVDFIFPGIDYGKISNTFDGSVGYLPALPKVFTHYLNFCGKISKTTMIALLLHIPHISQISTKIYKIGSRAIRFEPPGLF